MSTLTTFIATGLSAVVAVPILALAGMSSPGTTCLPAAATTGTAAILPTVQGAGPAADVRWDGEQTAIAATIVTVGQTKGVSPQGWVTAVATAMQESRLRNLPGGDADSIGVFQQRPSQGWGTPDQLTSPAYQAGKFYDALLAIPGWQTLPPEQAAQEVQRSAYPSAYAKWIAPATTLVSRLLATGDVPNAGALQLCADDCPAPASEPSASARSAGCLPGDAVLARAATWLTAWNGGPVPYSMSTNPAGWYGGYRRDCSGYASMALGLPGPGLTTAGLAARSTPIAKTDLRPGDLLINPAPGGAGHVVIFDRWVEPGVTYLAYEQSGDGGTHHRVLDYPYGAYQVSPYRFAK